MIIDDIDIDGLGDNAEEAFVVFEERLRAGLRNAQEKDERLFTDHDGHYLGSFAPQRYYVSSIMAFLDEYDLDIGKISDISKVDNSFFLSQFNDFFSSINYARTRFKLRKEKIGSGQIGTPIVIDSDYKAEIYKNLNTIRKIVNSNVQDENKKDAIYKKIANLQSEVDRDRTTIDAFFARATDLSRTISECAENLDPAIQRLERIMSAFGKGTKQIPRLPNKESQKLLPSVEKRAEFVDDEIPF